MFKMFGSGRKPKEEKPKQEFHSQELVETLAENAHPPKINLVFNQMIDSQKGSNISFSPLTIKKGIHLAASACKKDDTYYSDKFGEQFNRDLGLPGDVSYNEDLMFYILAAGEGCMFPEAVASRIDFLRKNGVNIFQNASPADINNFISKLTNGKMQNVVTLPFLSAVISGLYFKLIWRHQFDESLTTQGCFYDVNDNATNAWLMYKKETLLYGFLGDILGPEFEDTRVIRLDGNFIKPNYTAEDVQKLLEKRKESMGEWDDDFLLDSDEEDYKMRKDGVYVILPGKDKYSSAESKEEYMHELSKRVIGLWSDILSSLRPYQVKVTLPRMFLSSKSNLTDILVNTFPDLFSKEYNVLGIGGSYTIEHVTFLNLDEKGAEGGALFVLLTLGNDPMDVFLCNRPFILAVADECGEMIFFSLIKYNPQL
ncbi:MAG: serpin family protein [Candidatus Anstonellales archaeon]